MTDESKFLSFTEFKERFAIKTNFLIFYGVISSIKDLARVVQKVDNSIHRINHYPADSMVCFVNTYPLDSDLSSG